MLAGRSAVAGIAALAAGFVRGLAGFDLPLAPFYLRGPLDRRVARTSMMLFLVLTTLSALLFLVVGIATSCSPRCCFPRCWPAI